MKWIKLYTTEWIEGSIRVDLEPSERSIWADLLVMAAISRAPGRIERSAGIPYTIDQLAGRFVAPVELVKSAIAKCINEGRLKVDSDGTMVIVNWEKYQTANDKILPETRDEKKLRELRTQQRLNRTYPDTAVSRIVETVVDSKGNVIDHKEIDSRVIIHEQKQ